MDGWEAVLGGDRAGCYQPGYEPYGELLQRVAQGRHQSCLLVTSRERPDSVSRFGGKTLQLMGLDDAAAYDLLRERDLVFDPDLWAELTRLYRGNPQALHSIAAMIQDTLDGNVEQFFRYTTIVLGDLEKAIAEQILHLSDLEKAILCSLAQAGIPIDDRRLRALLPADIPHSDFLNALCSLTRRSLLEKCDESSPVLFTLQPVVMKYVRRNLLSRSP